MRRLYPVRVSSDCKYPLGYKPLLNDQYELARLCRVELLLQYNVSASVWLNFFQKYIKLYLFYRLDCIFNLLHKGYLLLAQNYRYGRSEVDILCKKKRP